MSYFPALIKQSTSHEAALSVNAGLNEVFFARQMFIKKSDLSQLLVAFRVDPARLSQTVQKDFQVKKDKDSKFYATVSRKEVCSLPFHRIYISTTLQERRKTYWIIWKCKPLQFFF